MYVIATITLIATYWNINEAIVIIPHWLGDSRGKICMNVHIVTVLIFQFLLLIVQL